MDEVDELDEEELEELDELDVRVPFSWGTAFAMSVTVVPKKN